MARRLWGASAIVVLSSCATLSQVPDGEGTRPAAVFEVDESIVIERDVEQVFAYVADYRRDASWRGEVVRMETDSGGAPGLGTKTTEVASVLGEALTTVTEVVRYDPPWEITAQTVRGAPLWLSSERTCTVVDGGTRFRYRVLAENTTSYPTFVLALGYRRIVRGYLRELKAQLESTARQPQEVAPAAR